MTKSTGKMICPHCKNDKSFDTIGVPNILKCSKCGQGFSIDEGWIEDAN